TVDAAQLVDGEGLGVFLAVGPRRRGSDDVDAVGRAGGGAHVAGDALDAALLVSVEAVGAAGGGRRHGRPLRGLHPEGAARGWSSATGVSWSSASPRRRRGDRASRIRRAWAARASGCLWRRAA